jgi:hypothetical protein
MYTLFMPASSVSGGVDQFDSIPKNGDLAGHNGIIRLGVGAARQAIRWGSFLQKKG